MTKYTSIWNKVLVNDICQKKPFFFKVWNVSLCTFLKILKSALLLGLWLVGNYKCFNGMLRLRTIRKSLIVICEGGLTGTVQLIAHNLTKINTFSDYIQSMTSIYLYTFAWPIPNCNWKPCTDCSTFSDRWIMAWDWDRWGNSFNEAASFFSWQLVFGKISVP